MTQRAPVPVCLIAMAGLLVPLAARATPRPLRSIQAIRALSPEEAAAGHPVHIRAVVTHYDERSRSGLIVHDGHAGQFVTNTENRPPGGARMDIQRGDLVEIEGTTTRGGFAPNVLVGSIRRLGRGALPAPKHLPLSALLTGRHDCEYVEVVGVGQRAWLPNPPGRTMFLDVAVEGGTIRATFWDHSPADLTRLIDARVRLRGNVGTLFSLAGQLRGVGLFPGRASDVIVEEAPPEPSSLPARSVKSLFRDSSGSRVSRRVRVRGVVTCQIVGRPVDVTDDSTSLRFRHVTHVLYLSDGTGGVRIETEQESLFQPGQRVDVVGFPTMTPGKPILRHAVIKTLGTEAEPRPESLAPGTTFSAENDAQLVSIEGRVLGTVAGPASRVLVLRAGESVFEAALEAAVPDPGLDDLRPGSRVRVTGVCAFVPGPPPSFRLHMRSPRDLARLASPPWWTLGHTLVTLVIVGLTAGAATLWIRSIARKNVVIREQCQAILTERSRLARELHDTLEQGLAGVKLQIEAVAGSLPASPPRARESLDVARQMLRYCLDEARRAIMDLRSQALESSDLAQALTRMAGQMTLGTSLTAEVRVTGAPRRLDARQEHHLLRIGLEALTNAVKHSGAARVDIELHFGSAHTELVVRDDGRGFGQGDSLSAGGHFGLRGVRERVDKMGGTLVIGENAGGGSEVAVRLPVRKGPDRPPSAER